MNIRIYPNKARTAPTDPDTPWCAATGPDPRPETAPPRGIISRKPRNQSDIAIAAVREVYNEWRAGA